MTREEWIRHSTPLIEGLDSYPEWLSEPEDDLLFSEWISVEGLPLNGRLWQYANDGQTMTVRYYTAEGMVRTHQWDDEEQDSYDPSALEFPDPGDFDANVALIWDWLAAADPSALPAVSVTAMPRPVKAAMTPPVSFDGTPESALRLWIPETMDEWERTRWRVIRGGKSSLLKL
ncbi:MAG: hypothetical protein M1499_06420 [Firmicutes bacterium]|nr:hypothetical protein [Bacillota bacterium]